MGLKMDKDVKVAQSTGAVEFDAEPITTEQVADAESTGAVEYVAPGETSVDYHGADAVVRQATTSEPVTMSVSWPSDAETKVVEPPEKSAPKKSQVAQTKKKS